MAKNFNMRMDTKSDGLHLRFKGDFDGTSALELVNFSSAPQ